MFEFGVASGDVGHGHVVLWTKVAPGAAVTWTCAPDDGDGPVLSGQAVGDAGTGSVHVPVQGLDAGRRYRYRFAAGDADSGDAWFRTIPTDRAVTYAVVCCAKYNSGFFNAYRAVARMDDLDFVLHLGDYIYEAAEVPTGKQTPGANIGRPMDPLGTCISYADYDTRYAEYRRDADLQLLHRHHAMIATIDDHELSDNAWSGGADEHVPARDGAWEVRRDGALRAWSDWMPTLRRPQEGDRVWREIPLGVAGRILLCETRLARSDPTLPDGQEKTELGHDQRAFVLDALGEPARGWTFLAMPSMIADLEAAVVDPDALFALHKLKMAESDSELAFHDLWEDFPTEQAMVRDAVVAADRTVVLSGDVHFSAEHASTVSSDAGAAGEYVEWTVTSVTSPNLDDKMGWPRQAQSVDYERALLRNLPELRWCDLDSHGFLVIDSDPQFVSCQWWFVDAVREKTDVAYMGHEAVLPARPEGTVNG